jgi:hypothetical protein
MDRIVQLGRELVRIITDPYRPELHYMRGPGPKWQAKHGRPARTHVPGKFR